MGYRSTFFAKYLTECTAGYKHFIGKDIRLEPVSLNKEDAVNQLLRFYMGENTAERQNFIIENLRIDQDINEEMFEETEI